MLYHIHDGNYLEKWLTTNKIETPCYVYDTNLLTDTLIIAKNACEKFFKNSVIHYALKANNNVKLLKLILDHGFGVDCVSGGEINYSLNQGFVAKNIVFAGVGKLDWEINLALECGIHAFNCESLEELIIINQLAENKNIIAKVMLRINPDIDAKTHKHISTGQVDNKFGVSIESVKLAINQIRNLKFIEITGLHYHVGSQIIDMQVYADLAINVNVDYQAMKELGFNFTELDLGGGLGIDYVNPDMHPITDFEGYFQTLANNLRIDDSITVHFELGRSLIAQCGAILSTVVLTKHATDYDFVIVDVGMNDLMRPALYDAKHKIISLRPSNEYALYSIVGPVCESTDIFAKKIYIPKLIRGDKIAILSCGAYGHVMANQYNLRPLIKEYLL